MQQYTNVEKLSNHLLQGKKKSKIYQIFQLFLDLCQVTNTKLKFFQANLLKFTTFLNRRLSMKAICIWQLIRHLIALIQKNKQNLLLCLALPFQNIRKFSTSIESHFYSCARKHKLKPTFLHDSLLPIPVDLNKKKMHS